MYINMGVKGQASDGNVWENCGLCSVMKKKDSLNVALCQILPHSDIVSSYVIVGDDAFPWTKYHMNPYLA